VQLDFIRPGKPVENSYIESFNGRLRNECLNVEVFFALADVRERLEKWRLDYNQVRPQRALGDRAPDVFAKKWWQELSSASAPTAGQRTRRWPSRAMHRSLGSETHTLFA
jgi:transposase InsO family protein